MRDGVNDIDHGNSTMFQWKTLGPGIQSNVVLPIKPPKTNISYCLETELNFTISKSQVIIVSIHFKPSYGEFDISGNVLGLVFNQGMIWYRWMFPVSVALHIHCWPVLLHVHPASLSAVSHIKACTLVVAL